MAPQQQQDFTAFKTSGIHSHYLTDTSRQVRQRTIVWDAYFKAHMMTQAELDRMLTFSRVLVAAEPAVHALKFAFHDDDAQATATTTTTTTTTTITTTGQQDASELKVPRITAQLNDYTQMLATEGTEYMDLLHRLLQKIVRVDTVQYLLVLLDDAIQISAFFPSVAFLPTTPAHKLTGLFQTLARCLQRDDEFVQLKALKLMAELFSQVKHIPEVNLNDALSYIVHHLHLGSRAHAHVVETCLQFLHAMLRPMQYRMLIYKYCATGPATSATVANTGRPSSAVSGSPTRPSSAASASGSPTTKTAGITVRTGPSGSLVKCLLSLLGEGATSGGGSSSAGPVGTPQVQYQVMTCLWLFSFMDDLGADLQRTYGVAEMVVNLLKSTMKEKVVRVCLALLRNMMTKARSAVVTPLIGLKVPQVIDNLVQRKWSDDEVKDDLTWLQSELQSIIQQLSTWDEYLSEVKSGKLEWSPPHLNESFWKQFASRASDKEGELIKLLNLILNTSSDAPSLAIACHDLTKLLKYNPTTTKKWVRMTGAKVRVMELMGSEDQDVKYHALVCTQAYMQHAWES